MTYNNEIDKMNITQSVSVDIEDIGMGRGKKVKELRDKMGMNRREFSDYFGIPYRTVQDWEAEKRELPEYVLRLMWYKAAIEKKISVSDKQ